MRFKNKKFFSVLLIALLTVVSIHASTQSRPFTIVIDPGHGGKDVGAVDNNQKEKDINLGVALALADKIKKGMKNVKVVLTRDNDSFISLQGRADKANKAKADLFISIHTNSVAAENKNRKTVAGASVYALGLHKDANNMEVARRENSVIELEKNFEQTYKGFDPNSDESYILFEMAQKKNLSQSIKFANEVQKQLVETAGRRDRKVHQAGFWVLWATSMPAVLVELDFICNPNSAVYMGSDKGQQQLATAIYNAVKKYRHDLSKSTASYNQPMEPETVSPVKASEGTAILASASSIPARQVTEAPKEESTYAPTKRRRRSAMAKTLSDHRNVESSSITINTHAGSINNSTPITADIKSTNPSESSLSSSPGNQSTPLTQVSSETGGTSQNSKNKKKNTSVRVYNNRVVTIGSSEPVKNALPSQSLSGKNDDSKKSKSLKKDSEKEDLKLKETEKSKAQSSESQSHLNRRSLRGKKS